MKIVDWILDLLYPRRCTFCHRVMETAEPVCRDCRRKLPYAEGIGQEKRLSDTLSCFAPLYYEGHVRSSLLRYKFQGAAMYAEVYGEFLSKCIDENGISCDIITWAPLSKRRLHRRGYDQARLLAEEVAKSYDLPCEALLRKRRNNPAQSRTGNAEKRKANVAGVYAAQNAELACGRRVLLVDDIVTSGATLCECAKVLKAAGAEEITALAVARKRD